MPDPAKTPLAELREVEERLAVRTARIDQLQAAVASQERSIRFGRALLMVGAVSAAATVLFGLRQPDPWTLDVLLAAVAVVLAVVTGLFSLAVNRLARTDAAVVRRVDHLLARRLLRSFSWRAMASPPPTRSPAYSMRTYSTWALLAVAPAVVAVLALGSVALALFSLAVALALMQAIWSREVSAPGMVQVAAPLVAIAAALSMGSWVGGVSAELFRLEQPLGGTRAAPAFDDGRSPFASRPIPAYASGCDRRAPESTGGNAAAVRRLREAWLSTGTAVAGCPMPAQAAGETSEIMAAVGEVDGQVRSIGIADRYRSTLLFGEAAAVTLRLLSSGDLRAVPIHLLVGGGDVYLVDAADGTYAFVRKAEGKGWDSTDPDPSAGGDYAVLPPQLTGLWVAAMQGSGWLWPVPLSASSGESDFAFMSPDWGELGRASCRSGSCEVTLEGELHMSGTNRFVGPGQILRYAPPPG